MADRRLLKDVTAIIKTFERPHALTRLLRSIQKFYPELRVIVGDGSFSPSPRRDVQYIRLPPDVGVSAGRNAYTGQNHEAWCSKSLPEWNADYIEEWLKHNTSFRSIHRLGVDEDSVPPFEKNYSRMLFACLR